MQKQNFSNLMYSNAIRKIRENHDYSIRDAIDKADLTAIVDIADLTMKRALADNVVYKELEAFFAKETKDIKAVKVGSEYDYIMQGSVTLGEVDDAADFLAACKLFIKYSSEYSICVNNGYYMFKFNVDRIDEGIYRD